jgi:REP element-mobilizing transposase RayT
MRHLRILKPDVWYEIRTAINNRESLFQRQQALSLFDKVLTEAKDRFVFEIRGLHLADDLLSFYIKPADGFELPDILKWIKQTFAVRYNLSAGRTGHIWGDRYWSLILEGEPPEGEYGRGRASEDEPLARAERGVRPLSVEMAIIAVFSPIFPPSSAPLPP